LVVAKALGLLDCAASLGLMREYPGVGRHGVKDTGDRERTLNLVAIDL
jgi:hypothetical protein